MSEACKYQAPNGEPSLLYRRLAARVGDTQAAFAWNQVRTPEYMKEFGEWNTAVAPARPDNVTVEQQEDINTIRNSMIANVADRMGISEEEYRKRLSTLVVNDLPNTPQEAIQIANDLYAEQDSQWFGDGSQATLQNQDGKTYEIPKNHKSLGITDVWLSRALSIKPALLARIQNQEQAKKAIDEELIILKNEIHNTDKYFLTEVPDSYIDFRIENAKKEFDLDEQKKWEYVKANKQSALINPNKESQRADAITLYDYLVDNPTYNNAFAYTILHNVLTTTLRKEEGAYRKVTRTRTTIAPIFSMTSAILPALFEDPSNGNNLLLQYKTIQDNSPTAFSINPENYKKYVYKQTENGTWYKFNQGDGSAYVDLQMLAYTSHDSAAPWCTGGSLSTATSHLNGGDFYIYTEDNKGVIAVRYNGKNKIAEAPRGRSIGQNLEPKYAEVLDDFLKTAPDGARYSNLAKQQKLLKKYNELGMDSMTDDEVIYLLSDSLDGYSANPARTTFINDVKKNVDIQKRIWGADHRLANTAQEIEDGTGDIWIGTFSESHVTVLPRVVVGTLVISNKQLSLLNQVQSVGRLTINILNEGAKDIELPRNLDYKELSVLGISSNIATVTGIVSTKCTKVELYHVTLPSDNDLYIPRSVNDITVRSVSGLISLNHSLESLYIRDSKLLTVRTGNDINVSRLHVDSIDNSSFIGHKINPVMCRLASVDNGNDLSGINLESDKLESLSAERANISSIQFGKSLKDLELGYRTILKDASFKSESIDRVQLHYHSELIRVTFPTTANSIVVKGGAVSNIYLEDVVFPKFVTKQFEIFVITLENETARKYNLPSQLYVDNYRLEIPGVVFPENISGPLFLDERDKKSFEYGFRMTDNEFEDWVQSNNNVIFDDHSTMANPDYIQKGFTAAQKIYRSTKRGTPLQNTEVYAPINLTVSESFVPELSKYDIIGEDELPFQPGRGAILKLDNKSIIFLNKISADPTTELHEYVHEYERVLSPQEKQTILAWTGETTWTKDTSEAFAKGFERYLYEGKSNVPGLQDIFERFAKWLKEIFDSEYFNNVPELNDDVKFIYDVMITRNNSTATITPSPKTFSMESGGADGADTVWHLGAVKAGIPLNSIRHWREPSNLTPNHRMPMNFEDGTGGRQMRPENKGKSTLELIREGKRTATSRSPVAAVPVKPGDIIEFYSNSGKSAGDRILVRVTTEPYPLSQVTAEEWSSLEGWSTGEFEKIKAEGYTQFRYEVIQTDVDSPVLRGSGIKAIQVPQDVYQEGKAMADKIDAILGRNPNRGWSHYRYRNYAQVKNASAVYAISSGFKNVKLPGGKEVFIPDDRGTIYAIMAAVLDGKPVFVFDQAADKWYTYDKTTKTFVETTTPTLVKNFAGVGTRHINDNGRRAIDDVFKKTFGIAPIKHRLDPNGEPVVEDVMNNLGLKEITAPDASVVNDSLNVNIEDVMSPLSPNYMVAPNMLVEVDLGGSETVPTHVSNINQLMAIMHISHLDIAETEERSKKDLLKIVEGGFSNPTSLAFMVDAMKQDPGFNNDAWQNNKLDMLFEAMRVYFENNPVAAEPLMSAYGRPISVSSPFMDITAEQYEETLYRIQRWLSGNPEGKYSQKVGVTEDDLSRNVTMTVTDADGKTRYMSHAEFAEASDTVKLLVFRIIAAKGENVTIDDIRNGVKEDMKNTVVAYSKIKEEGLGRITYADAQEYIRNLTMLLSPVTTGGKNNKKLVVDKIIDQVLASQELRKMGIESDSVTDIRVKEGGTHREFDAPHYTIGGHKTAPLVLKAWLSSMTDMVRTNRMPSVNIRIESLVQRQLLMTEKWNMYHRYKFMDKTRNLMIRTADVNRKKLRIKPGETAIMSVSVGDGNPRRFIVKALTEFNERDRSELAALIREEGLEGKDLTGAVILEIEAPVDESRFGVKELRNRFGSNRLADYNALYHQLVSLISPHKDIKFYSEDESELTAMKLMANSPNPNIRAVHARFLKAMKSPARDGTKLPEGDQSFQNMFMSVMDQADIKMFRTLIEYGKDEQGFTTGLKVYVTSSNRNSDLRTLKRNWKMRQQFSAVSIPMEDGTYRLNQEILSNLQAKVKLFYDTLMSQAGGNKRFVPNQDEKTEAKTLAAEVLNAHGIEFNDESLDDLIDNANAWQHTIKGFIPSMAGLFSFKADGTPSGLISMLTTQVRGANPMDVNESGMSTLARVYLNNDKLAYPRAFRNINNNNVYPHSNPTFTDKLNRMILRDPEFRAMHRTDVLHGLNPYITSDNFFSQLQNMEVHIEDGIKRRDSDRIQGRERAKMTPADQDMESLALFFGNVDYNTKKLNNSASFLSQTHSDKPVSYEFRMAFDREAMQAWMSVNGQLVLNVTNNSTVFDHLMSVIRMEYSRQLHGKGVGDKLWYLMPQMAPSNLVKLVDAGLLSPEEYNIFYDLDGNFQPTFMEGTSVLRNKILPWIAHDMVNRQISEWQKNKTLLQDGSLPADQNVIANYMSRIGMMNPGLPESTYKSLAQRAMAYDYVINRYLFNSLVLSIYHGDPALAAKPAMAGMDEKTMRSAVLKEYMKRLAGPIAPGRYANVNAWSTRYVRSMVIQDPKILLQETGVEADTIADAQEFWTVREFLEHKHAYGEITTALFHEMLAVVDEGEKQDTYEFTKPAHKAILRQPLKPVTYGIRNTGDRVVRDYVKSSVFILYPPTIGTGLNTLRKLMENKGDKGTHIGRAHMMSARKLGFPEKNKAFSLFDKDANSLLDPYAESTRVAAEQATVNIDRQFTSIQQYVPYDEEKDHILIVTQANKNILDSVQERLKTPLELPWSAKSIAVKDINRAKEEIVKKLLLHHSRKVFKDFGINLDEAMATGAYPRANEAVVRDHLHDIAKMLDMTPTQLATLTSRTNGEFTIPVEMNASFDRIQTMLMNAINKALKLYLPGKSFVQTTSAGMAITDTGDRPTGITYIEGYDPSQRLSSMVKKDGAGGKVIKAQIMIPWNFRYTEGPNKGELIPIESVMKETADGRKVIDPEKLPEQLRSVVAMRIPNQSHSSMLSMEIVGFLDTMEGARAVVPADIARQMGSDFDVDKLYTYMYNYTAGENGIFVVPSDAQGDLSEQANQNEYIEMFEAILTHPDMYDKTMQSIDMPVLKNARKLFKEPDVEGSFMEGFYQDGEFHKQKNGKDLVAVFAKAKTFDPIIQELSMPMTQYDPDNQEKTFPVLNVFAIVNPDGSRKVIELKQIGGHGKRRHSDGKVYGKGDLISVLLGEAVDYSKNRTIDNLNINLTTAPIITALLFLQEQGRYGMISSMDEIVAFLKQPVVMEYYTEKNSSSILGRKKSDLEVMNEIYKRKRPVKAKKTMPDGTVVDVIEQVSYSELVEDGPENLTSRSMSTLGRAFTLEEYVAMADDPRQSRAFHALQARVLFNMQALLEVGNRIRTIQSRIDSDVNGLGATVVGAGQYLKESIKMEEEYNGPVIGFVNEPKILYPTRKAEDHSIVARYAQAVSRGTEKQVYNVTAEILYNSILPAILPISGLDILSDNLIAAMDIDPDSIWNKEEFYTSIVEGVRGYATAIAFNDPTGARKQLSKPYMVTMLEKLKQRFPDNMFLRNLFVHQKDFVFGYTPVVLRYRGSDMVDVSDVRINNDFNDLLVNPDQEVSEFIYNAVRGELLFGNTQDGSSFARYIHPSVYNRLGVTPMLRAVHQQLMDNATDWLKSNELFLRNFIQHNPEYTNQLNTAAAGIAGRPMTLDFSESVKSGKTDHLSSITRPSISGVADFVRFFHIKGPDGVALYERVNDNGVYKNISILGNSVVNEYGSSTSIFPDNVLYPSITLNAKAPYAAVMPTGTTMEEKLRVALMSDNQPLADKAILNSIANNELMEDYVRSMAGRLMGIEPVSDLPLSIKRSEDPERPFYYSLPDNTIYVSPENAGDLASQHNTTVEEIYLHEALHSRLNTLLNKADSKLVARLGHIMTIVRDRLRNDPNFAAWYGLDMQAIEKSLFADGKLKLFEFMVLANLDARFMRALNAMSYEGTGSKSPKTVFEYVQRIMAELISAMQRFLGKDSGKLRSDIDQNNVLFELHQLTNKVMRNEGLDYQVADFRFNNTDYKVWSLNGVPHHVSFADTKKSWRSISKSTATREAHAQAVMSAYMTNKREVEPVEPPSPNLLPAPTTSIPAVYVPPVTVPTAPTGTEEEIPYIDLEAMDDPAFEFEYGFTDVFGEVNYGLYDLGNGRFMNEGQKRATAEIINFLSKRFNALEQKRGYRIKTNDVSEALLEVNSWLLSGAGGTGKTTIIKKIVAHLARKYNISSADILYLAPTHAAREQLGAALGFSGPAGMTIAKFVGRRPEVIFDYTDKDITENNFEITEPLMSRSRLVIVDEMSMINEEDMAYLKEYLSGVPVLFAGDSSQAPPINTYKYITATSIDGRTTRGFGYFLPNGQAFFPTEEEKNQLSWPVRTLPRMGHYSVLSQNMRAGFQDLSSFIQENRDLVDKVDNLSVDSVVTGISYDVVNTNNVKFLNNPKEFLQDYFSKLNMDDLFNQVILSYRNDVRIHYNKVIHNVLFPNETDMFGVGEHVIQRSSQLILHDAKAKMNLTGNYKNMRMKILSNQGIGTTVQYIKIGKQEVAVVFPDMRLYEVEAGYTRSDQKRKTGIIALFPKGIDVSDINIWYKYWDVSIPFHEGDLKSRRVDLRGQWWMESMFVANGFTVIDGHLHVPSGREYYRLQKIVRSAVLKLLKDNVDSHTNTLIGVDYAYASTVHSAQGAGFNHVFVVDSDIRNAENNLTENRARLLYTAYSRARESVTSLNNRWSVSANMDAESAWTLVQSETGLTGVPIKPNNEHDRNKLNDISDSTDIVFDETSGYMSVRKNKTGEKLRKVGVDKRSRMVIQLDDMIRELKDKLNYSSTMKDDRATARYNVELSNIIDLRSKMVAASDLTAAISVAKAQLEWVEKTLANEYIPNVKGNAPILMNLSINDMNLMAFITKTWSDLDRTVFIGALPGSTHSDRDAFMEVEQKARDLHQQVVTALVDVVHAKYMDPDEERPSIYEELSADSQNAVVGMYLRSIANSPSRFLATAGNIMKNQMIARDLDMRKTTEKINKLEEELKRLLGKDYKEIAWKKLTRQGRNKNGDRYWGMLSRYSATYYTLRSYIRGKYKRLIAAEEKSAISGPAALQHAIETHIANMYKERSSFEVVVDLRKLVDKDGNVLPADSASYKIEWQRIQDETGEADRLFEVALQKWSRWKADLEAYSDSLTTQLAIGLIDTPTMEQKLREYNENLNPLYFLEGRQAPGELGFDQDKYTVFAPKLSSPGMHDEDYAQLMSSSDPKDQALIAWMEEYKKLIGIGRDIMPNHIKYKIHDSFIPVVRQDVLQKYKNFEEYLSAYEKYANEAVSAKNWEQHLTYGESIPIRFTGDGKNVMDEEQYDTYSHDLIRTLEMFTNMSLHYQHSSLIYESVKSFDILMQEVSAVREASRLTGLHNMQKAFEYTVDKLIYQIPVELEAKIGKSYRFLTLDVLDKNRARYTEANKELNDIVEERTVMDNRLFAGDITVEQYSNRLIELATRELELRKEIADIEAMYPERQVYGSKIADKLIRLTQIGAFAWNPISAVVNGIMAHMTANITAAGSNYIDDKIYSKAFRRVTMAPLTRDTKFNHKLTAFMEDANMMGEMKETWYGQTNLNSGKRWWSKLANPFVLMQEGDRVVRAAVSYAYLLDPRNAVEVNGEKVLLWDLLDDDGRWNSAKFPDVKGWGDADPENGLPDYTNYSKTVSKIQRVLEQIVGATDPRNPILAKKSFVGRLLGQFRLSWIPEAYTARWGSRQYDSVLEEWTQGRWRSIGDVGLGNSIKIFGRMLLQRSAAMIGIKGDEQKIFEGFVTGDGEEIKLGDMHANNLKMSYREMIYLARLFAMILLLRNVVGDEDEPLAKFALTMLLNILIRQRQDIMFFADPTEFSTILRGFIPAITTVDNFGKMLKASYKYVTDEEYTFEQWAYRFARNGIILPWLNPIGKVWTFGNKDLGEYSTR